MALIKAAARLIVREQARYRYSGPILCLGVPDVYLTARELALELGIAQVEASGPRGFVSADAFFASLGLPALTSIDIPGAAHSPDRIHDLNRPFPDELVGHFGLVVDPGTTEHVFDVRSGLSNVVRALRPGGVVIHFVPVYSYNGGYFSMNPNVLVDFYSANGFIDIRSFVIMWDRYRPFSGRSRVYEYGPSLTARHALADRDQVRFTPHLLLFARKGAGTGEIVVPIQHEDHAPERRPRFLGRLARLFLPEATVLYLAAWIRRELQLRRSRRASFWV